LIFVNIGFISAFSGLGNGSIGNPFQITNCTQLQEMNNNLTKNYILNNSINCSDTKTWNAGKGFLPIGNQTSIASVNVTANFSGSFNGQGYTISDLYIKRNDYIIGLIGYNDGINSIIQNVKLINVNISNGIYTAGLVGAKTGGAIINSSVDGTVITQSYGGLLVAFSGAYIENCSSSGSISGVNSSVSTTDKAIGGLIGSMDNFMITNNSLSSANVFSSSGNIYVSGLVGLGSYGGIIKNSNASGNVTAYSPSGISGGIYGTITNSFFTGILTDLTINDITNCEQLQNISYNLNTNYTLMNNINCSDTKTWNAGKGFLPLGTGTAFNGILNGQGFNITNLYISTGTLKYAGLFNQSYGTIKNIGLVDVSITAYGGYAGTLVAYNLGTINNTFSTGNLTIYCGSFGSSNCYGGGLVGVNFGNVSNSHTNLYVLGYGQRIIEIGGLIGNNVGGLNKTYTSGNVHIRSSAPYATGDAQEYDAGGLVGSNSHTIDQSYSTGGVYIDFTDPNTVGFYNSKLGGLVGTSSGTILNSYSTSGLSGYKRSETAFASTRYGGLVGSVSSAVINNSYSTGSTITYDDGLNFGMIPSVGGLCGYGTSTTTSSYWDMNTSALTTSACGTGENTTQMQTQLTFTNWNFNNIWGINDTYTYPYLLFNFVPVIQTIFNINVTLLTPAYNQYFNYNTSINFTFIPATYSVLNVCQLWMNTTGNWTKIYTWNTPLNNTNNSRVFNLPDNYYTWNVVCNDTYNNNGTSINNYTFTVDTLPPIINSNISITTVQNNVFFKTNITGANLCNYTILDGNLSVNGLNQNIPFVCNQLSSASTSGYGNFTFVVDAYDFAGNSIQQIQNFTTTYVAPPSTGGNPPPSNNGNPVINSNKPVLTEGNWTMETELGGNNYGFSMIQNSNRTRDMLFENLGVNDRTISMSCVEVNGTANLCDGITFKQDTFDLPVQKSIKTSNGFTLAIPSDLAKGTYIVNLVGTDESGNVGVITLNVKITSGFSITGAITKLFSDTNGGIPYVLFFFLIWFIFGVLSNFIIFKPAKLPSALSVIVGLIFGIIFLLLPL